MTSFADLTAEQRSYVETTLAMMRPTTTAIVTKHLTDRQLYVWLAIEIDKHTPARIGLAMNLDEATVRGHHKRAIRRLNNARKEQAA